MLPTDSAPRSPSWVSKTELLRFLRCPYAFYLLDRGLLRFEDTVNEQQIRLINDGVSFHGAVEVLAEPDAIEPTDLPDVLAETRVRLFNVPVFENPELQIYGKPDGIDTAKGALFPVEIKSHKYVQHVDELELAFYWLLLEPRRTKRVAPRGYLLLRRNEGVEEVTVEIKPRHLDRVRELLLKIREARHLGVRPRICPCTVCSGIMRDPILRTTLANKDLSLIWDVGPVRAERLEEVGITTWQELASSEPNTIVGLLREKRCYVSQAQVVRWKHHAASYSSSQPVLFGDALSLAEAFIALDLEYGPRALIWLIGACVVSDGRRECFPLWADTPAEEKANLKRLEAIAVANPALPVITWNGSGADLPQLRSAARRNRIAFAMDVIESRHVDVYQHVTKAVRFPMPRLGLRDVAEHFGLRRVSNISGGLEAQSLYEVYRTCKHAGRRDALKADLLRYNRDDLEALVGVSERIAALRSQ